MKTKKAIINPEFANPVGKSSLLRIDWKSWKDECPKNGTSIWVILKFTNGYVPVTGTYLDHTLPASSDGHFPETRWRSVKFDDFEYPDIFVGMRDKNEKRMIAWGVHRGVVSLGTDCKKCKMLQCNCK